MSGDEPSPRFTRDNARSDAGSPFAWLVPVALTGLVIFLAWRLYQTAPKDVRDPNAQTRPVTPRGDLAADEKATIELYNAARGAVVQVTNLRNAADVVTGNQSEVPQGTGSGFVWDPAGYVVTNFHVVNEGDAFTVTFADHSSFDARRVGADEVHDLAVLKIESGAKKLPALRIGTSRGLQVGQKVFAIGNPFGLDQTLTTGIISGLNREIESPIFRSPIQGVIQTDAAINRGNSGGPLLDSAGRVIGMNTQIASPSGASAGVAFAIPVDTINKVVPQIIRTGHAVRPGLGVHISGSLSVPDGRVGIVFNSFTKTSGAQRAGLKASNIGKNGRVLQLGDVVVSVDGQPVETHADLVRILEAHEIGQEVDVTFVRDGREQTAKVNLVGVE
jgi:S1-C subfamily serine protease